MKQVKVELSINIPFPIKAKKQSPFTCRVLLELSPRI